MKAAIIARGVISYSESRLGARFTVRAESGPAGCKGRDVVVLVDDRELASLACAWAQTDTGLATLRAIVRESDTMDQEAKTAQGAAHYQLTDAHERQRRLTRSINTLFAAMRKNGTSWPA